MKHAEVNYQFSAGVDPVIVTEEPTQRIGIYASSFDPVHAGHLVFALKAQKAAGLDQVYFVPERRPGYGGEPEHHVHRSVMLQNALELHEKFGMFDVPDARLNLRSFNRIQRTQPAAEYSLLTSASDLLWYRGELPTLYERLPLIIAVTSPEQMSEVLNHLASQHHHISNITFVDIGTDHISSASVRHAIRQGRHIKGLLPSVWRYARKQWLYLPPIHR